jgi:NAD(P)H-dependent flavin oxidoreductase YrpB (nitropropane dioxygenase family)
MRATRFTELVGCAVPLQLAPLDGVGTGDLAVAVTNAGGLGMLPAAAGRAALEVVRARAKGPFGVNFLMPFLEDEAVTVEAAASTARLVEFFYAEPDPALVERVHVGGALAAWQVGSAEEARAAADAGCDLIIAQGIEAGGHVRGVLGLFTLLEQVLGSVDLPVLAAGGIGTGKAMASALAAGADGVRVGTRFVAAHESNAHPGYVEALIAAEAGGTVLTEAFSSNWPEAPHRVLRSSVAALDATAEDVVAYRETAAGEVPIERASSIPPARNVRGAIAAMALYAGESVGAVRGLQPAAEIVRELVDEAEALLAGAARG